MTIKYLKKFSIFFLISILVSSNVLANEQMITLSPPESLPLLFFNDGEKTIKVDQFLGQYILINFWATWCVPCVTEMPALNNLAKKLRKKGLTVITVSQDITGPSIVEPFLAPMMLKNILVWYDDKNKSFRFLFMQSNEPDLINISRGLLPNLRKSIRLEKSKTSINAPCSCRLVIISSTAPIPTFFNAPSA